MRRTCISTYSIRKESMVPDGDAHKSLMRLLEFHCYLVGLLECSNIIQYQNNHTVTSLSTI